MPTSTTSRSSSWTSRTTRTRSASRGLARSGSSASPRRSPTRSIMRPEPACATSRSRWISCTAREAGEGISGSVGLPIDNVNLTSPLVLSPLSGVMRRERWWDEDAGTARAQLRQSRRSNHARPIGICGNHSDARSCPRGYDFRVGRRSGSEHGAEAGAGRLPQAFAKILGDAQIGQAQDSPTPKLYGRYVERVCLAVLGELGPDDTISTPALVRDVILDTSKHSIEATHGGNYVLSHPVDDCLGEAAAHRRRGGERHSRFIGKHDCLEPNDVLHRALACPDNRRQAWGDCKVSGKTLTAQGRFRRFGIDCGRGSEPRPRSRQWNSRSNGEFAGREKESQSRESFKPHGQPSGGRQPHPSTWARLLDVLKVRP